MAYMFYGTDSFNRALDSWDTSQVTDMSYMFSFASSFNRPLSDWNTSSVTNMEGMFFSAEDFNQPLISVSDYWDTSKVQNMKHMFEGALSFNQDIESWDTSALTWAYGMFKNAEEFDQDVSAWDVSNLVEATDMFHNTHLSVENYGFLLWGWASQLPHECEPACTLTVGQRYPDFASEARDYLATFWTVVDAGPEPFAPERAVSPTVTGSAKVGRTVTVNRGVYRGAPTPALTQQWYRCTKAVGVGLGALPTTSKCVAIKSATRSTYKVTRTDKGKYLVVVVTARNSQGSLRVHSRTTSKVS
jgi:surface protein